MIRETKTPTILFASRDEGRYLHDMEIFYPACGVDAAIDGLRTQGYRIFYVYNGAYIVDDIVAESERKAREELATLREFTREIGETFRDQSILMPDDYMLAIDSLIEKYGFDEEVAPSAETTEG